MYKLVPEAKCVGPSHMSALISGKPLSLCTFIKLIAWEAMQVSFWVKDFKCQVLREIGPWEVLVKS